MADMTQDFNQTLYLFALDKAHREGQSHEDWVAAAHSMMPVLAEGFGVTLTLPEAPTASPKPMVSGESTTTIQPAPSAGLGAAFDGWPQAELRQILVAAQEATFARLFGGSESQQAETKQRYDEALDKLVEARRAQQAKDA